MGSFVFTSIIMLHFMQKCVPYKHAIFDVPSRISGLYCFSSSFVELRNRLDMGSARVNDLKDTATLLVPMSNL